MSSDGKNLSLTIQNNLKKFILNSTFGSNKGEAFTRLIMVHIVFVLDTSASMNQRNGGTLPLLDCAKGAIEHAIKVRLGKPEGRQDRFLLVTFEEGMTAIRAGWHDPLSVLLSELKNIRATTYSNAGVLPTACNAHNARNRERVASADL